MKLHTYPCPSQLATGPCPNAVPCECVGPFSQDGGRFSCAGSEPCDDCLAAIYAGKRCDSCGVIDESVGGDGPKDRYCPACLTLTEGRASMDTGARDE